MSAVEPKVSNSASLLLQPLTLAASGFGAVRNLHPTRTLVWLKRNLSKLALADDLVGVQSITPTMVGKDSTTVASEFGFTLARSCNTVLRLSPRTTLVLA